MTISISGPVGDLSLTRRPGNDDAEVLAIAKALGSLDPSAANGADAVQRDQLVRQIRRFQRLAFKRDDGRVDPGGRTLRVINRLLRGKVIVVDLKREVLKAMNSGRQHFLFDSASGDRQHPTPPGLFQVHRKHEIYRSKTYDVQMNYAMFFHRGYAIHMAHGVVLTSYLKYSGLESFGSHGCVRLSEENARVLFHWTPMTTPVLIWPDKG